MRKISNKQIREYLGHGQGSFRIRITRPGSSEAGQIHSYGSIDPTDRSKDFWAFAEWKEDVIREITQMEIDLEIEDK